MGKRRSERWCSLLLDEQWANSRCKIRLNVRYKKEIQIVYCIVCGLQVAIMCDREQLEERISSVSIRSDKCLSALIWTLNNIYKYWNITWSFYIRRIITIYQLKSKTPVKKNHFCLMPKPVLLTTALVAPTLCLFLVVCSTRPIDMVGFAVRAESLVFIMGTWIFSIQCSIQHSWAIRGQNSQWSESAL